MYVTVVFAFLFLIVTILQLYDFFDLVQFSITVKCVSFQWMTGLSNDVNGMPHPDPSLKKDPLLSRSFPVGYGRCFSSDAPILKHWL